MPTPQKYFGPCDVHSLHESSCKHCRGWAARMRKTGGPQVPRKPNPRTTGKTWQMTRVPRRELRQNGMASWNGTLGKSWSPSRRSTSEAA